MSNHARVTLDRDAIASHLDALSREPFRQSLAEFLEAAPDAESLMEWAKAKPDRWAQSLAIVARLSGYTDKLEIEGTVQHLHGLSDAEILARVEQLRQSEAIEGEASQPAELPPAGDE